MIKIVCIALIILLLNAGVSILESFAAAEKLPEQKVPAKTGCSSEDLSAVKSVVAALYEGLSAVPGVEPNWSSVRPLFISLARIIPPPVKKDSSVNVMDVDSFMDWSKNAASQSGVRLNGFYEREIASVVEFYGNIAHVFSTYEARNRKNDPEPFERGIKSIQLVKENGIWLVATVMWDTENDEKSIPKKYLKNIPPLVPIGIERVW